MDTLRGIFEFIKKLNKEWGSLFTIFCSFIFSCFSFICVNFLIKRIYDGYLSTFNITSSLSILSPLSSTYIFLFVVIILYSFSLVFISFQLFKSIFQDLDKIKSEFYFISIKKYNTVTILFKEKSTLSYTMYFSVKFYLHYVLICFIPTAIFMYFIIKPIYSSGLIYTIAYLISIIVCNLMISVFATIFTIPFYITEINNIKRKVIKNNSFENFFDKFFEKNIIPIHFLIFAFIFLFGLDGLSFTLGTMISNSVYTYPSFSENQTQYVVIANMPDNKYLVVNIKSCKEINRTEYIIRSLDNIELKDIDVNEYFE